MMYSDDDEFPLRLQPEESAVITAATVSKYRLPKVNFQAETYVDLIDWEAECLSEPPLTWNKTDEEILSFKETPFAVPKYPCHTQAVERAVRLVVGEEARNGFIQQSKRAPYVQDKVRLFSKNQITFLSEGYRSSLVV